MGKLILFVSMTSIWATVIGDTYLRIFAMPKWFARPPESPELIKKQNRASRRFWILFSVIFIITLSASLVIFIYEERIRNVLFAALACFILNGILSGIYFTREIIAFTKVTVDSPIAGELHNHFRFWMRWLILRDILQLFTAVLVTLAYSIEISVN